MSVKETEHTTQPAWPAPLAIAHQNGEVYVTLYQRENYIEAKWAGHITASNVVTACKAYLEIVERHSCRGLLNDKTDVTGDWAEANDWLEFEWTPRSMRAGLRCLAHVYSNNMFSRLSARDLYMRLQPRLDMQNFFDRESALSWLQARLIAAREEPNPTPQS